MSFDFSKTFTEITATLDANGIGFQPYQWQQDLFDDWQQNRFRPISIPGGLGKSCVMVIWVLALASQASRGLAAVTLPRRLVHVVDRRTVIDHSTAVAEVLLDWVDKNQQHPVTLALKSLSSCFHLRDEILSISTLRGDLADDDEWKSDPARPAIIIGTVQKIGSRLLFWGEGDGRTMRSMHAGMLGQDVLLVHDDEHLSPAFGRLIDQILAIRCDRPSLKPFHYVPLTIIPPPEGVDALVLPKADRSNRKILQRLHASKTLALLPLGADARLNDKRAAIIEKALSYEAAGVSVLIYITSPEEAAIIARELQKRAKECETRFLIGMLRGKERDELASSTLFRQFQRKQPVKNTIYLVCTAAGEMSVDMDADVGIFDLSTIDSFGRRAGRTNRAGGDERKAEITLIYTGSDHSIIPRDKPPEIDTVRLDQTLTLLKTLPRQKDSEGFDVSPHALSQLLRHKDYPQAATPLPRMRKLEPYLLDTWSMTEPIPRVGPAVAPWVLGITDYDPSQTSFIWRRFPGFPSTANAALFSEWLAAYPVRIAERARLRTHRAEKYLEALASQLGDLHNKTPIPVINRRNEVVKVTLGQVQSNFTSLLSEATVILPAEWGGLSAQGIPDPASAGKIVKDVADIVGEREHWSLFRKQGKWVAARIDDMLELDADVFDEVVLELEQERDLRVLWMNVQRSDLREDAEIVSAHVYLVAKRPGFPDDEELGAQVLRPQALDAHLASVGKSARAIGEALNLPRSLVDNLAVAGAVHDRGKNRSWWQHAAGNYSQAVLAKCDGRRAQWRRLRGYRHEFGSMMELLADNVDDDLVLHLVSSHHGRSRPGFDTRAFDNTYPLAMNEQASFESQLRFERLQQRYGWWGLAYLEALVKCADITGAMENEYETIGRSS